MSKSIEIGRYRCHDEGPTMTKAELQTALGVATQTDKRTAGVFLDALGALAYKETKKNGEFVLPGFGKLVKQKRKACSKRSVKPGREIILAPLAREDLGRLIADSLHSELERVTSLAQLDHEKTAGNPLFAIHCLAELCPRAEHSRSRSASTD
jgi:nucleoid DNA-binding protein